MGEKRRKGSRQIEREEDMKVEMKKIGMVLILLKRWIG